MNIFTIIKELYQVFDKQTKSRVLKVVFLILLGAFIDIVGLSTVFPVIAISSSPELIEQNVLVKNVFEFLNFSKSSSFLMLVYISLLLVFILRGIIFLLIKYKVASFSFGLTRKYSKKLFSSYLYKPLGFIKENKSSDLTRDVFINTQHFATFLVMPVIQALSEFTVLIMILCGLILYNMQVFLLLIVVVGPVTVLFYSLTKRKMEKIGVQINDLNGEILNKVNQGISGYVDVKLSGKEGFFINRFGLDQDKYQKLNISRSVLLETFPKIIEIAAVLGIVVIFIYSLFSGEDQKGGLLVVLSLFAASAYRILPSINRIIASMLLIKQYHYLLDVLKKAADFDDSILDEELEEDKFVFTFDHEITLSGINYKYGDKEDFEIDIPNLVIKKGDVLGVIGKSGSGKTTLINLLLSFSTAVLGEIKIDGKVLDEKWTPSWRRKIGYVQQDVFVADASLRENIAFGETLENIDDAKVKECLKVVLLEDYYFELDKGIYTELGENGAKMSGGQKQRLAIARALYFNREVLIFDEATSALDNETEKEITDTIRALNNGQLTMIIVAHRYSTLKYCSRIIELNRGKIESEKSFDDLRA